MAVRSSRRSPRRGLRSSTTSSSVRPDSAASAAKPTIADGFGSAGRVSRSASTASRAIATTSAWSSPSRIVNAGGTPTSGPYRCSSRRQMEWKVPAVTPLRSAPVRRAARSTISRAARRVNVTSMTASGGVPVSARWASVATIVRVLPEPAEASTSARPRAPSTAASCSGSSMARRRSDTPPRGPAGRSR